MSGDVYARQEDRARVGRVVCVHTDAAAVSLRWLMRKLRAAATKRRDPRIRFDARSVRPYSIIRLIGAVYSAR